MRVLMAAPYVTGLISGGGEIQVRRTGQELAKLGVQIRFHEPLNGQLDVDIVHCFGSYPYFIELMERAQAKQVKVVISPILWPSAAPTLVWIKRWIWFRSFPSLPVLRRLPESQVATLLREADLLLPNSEAERRLLIHLVGADPSRIAVVPNGVDLRFADANPELFRKRLAQPFVLNVANIGWQKNQLRLIRAIKQLRRPLVIIGRELEPDYVRRCKAEGNGWVEFLGPLLHDDPLLAGAYAAAKVFALPSLRETPGLAALEAALAGTRVVVTTAGCAREYLAQHGWYCNPLSVADIAAKIDGAWHAGDPSQEQKAHVAQFSWERAARITLGAYEEVLGAGSGGSGDHESRRGLGQLS